MDNVGYPTKVKILWLDNVSCARICSSMIVVKNEKIDIKNNVYIHIISTQMFSFLSNWFHSSSPTSSPTSSPVPSQEPPKVHVLSDSEFTTIMDRLHQLESIIRQNQYSYPSTPEIVEPKISSSLKDAFQQELIEKVSKISRRMGESHGFSRDDLSDYMDLEKSVCLHK